MITVLVAHCTDCGVLSMVPAERVSDEHKPSAGEDQEPLSRCGLVYETDSGDEPCEGNLYLLGELTLKPSF